MNGRNPIKNANRGRLPSECLYQQKGRCSPQKKRGTCASCLWNWEDVHKLDGTRVCYLSSSPKFHTQIKNSDSCTGHENRR